jgi:trehalose 6-phosphate phosphatase
MNHILSGEHRGVLERLAGASVLVAFDYDGTLAPIIPDPKRVAMRRSTRSLLRELARLYPVVVVTGRGRADASRKLRGLGVQQIIGNHGVEPWHATSRLSAEVKSWLPTLEARLRGLDGVTVEDKRFSVSIHYRNAREKRVARSTIETAAAALGRLRIVGGKHVVNLLPVDAPHKGTALAQERARFRCDAAIYVGDDETDEDVFGIDAPGRLLGIRVGRCRTSAARYYIRNQWAIDDLLDLLVDLRRGAAARPRLTR